MQDVAAYMLGGALVVTGAALLAWGRHLGRSMIMIGAGVAGYFLAGLPDFHFLPPIAMQMILILVMLALGFVLERIFWGALAAALLAAIAAVVKTHLTIGPVDHTSKSIGEFVAYLWNGPEHRAMHGLAKESWPGLQNVFPTSWNALGAYPLAPAVVVAVLIMLVAIFRPKWIRIVMTSTIGAAVVAAGLALVVCRVLPAYWTELWARLVWVLAGAGALAVLGMLAQFMGMARSRPQKTGDDKTAQVPTGSPGQKQEAH
jgi:hypothetical protein